jgi:hypothetical protein
MKRNQQEDQTNRADPTPEIDFTKKVMQKAVSQQTLKDYLFMIVVGFRDTLMGFFQPKTLQHLDKDKPK